MRTKKEELRYENEQESRLLEFAELFYGTSDNSYPEKMKIELKKAILNLKPFYKEVIISFDFDGLSYKEISEETGIPEGTLMSRRHRALSILHKHLVKKTEKNN